MNKDTIIGFALIALVLQESKTALQQSRSRMPPKSRKQKRQHAKHRLKQLLRVTLQLRSMHRLTARTNLLF